MKRGVSSSLALLASVMVLMAQISINVAFTKIISNEAIKRVNEVIEDSRIMPRLILVVNGSSVVVVNDCEGVLSVTGLTLYYLSGDTLNLEVNWSVPSKSVASYEVSPSLNGCIAAAIRINGYGRLLLPVSRV